MAALPSPHSAALPASFPLGRPLASPRRRRALIGRGGCPSPAARRRPAHRALLSGTGRRHRVRNRGEEPGPGGSPRGVAALGAPFFHPGACSCEPNARLATKALDPGPSGGAQLASWLPHSPCRHPGRRAGAVPGAVPVLDWALLGPTVVPVFVRLCGVWSVESVRMCKKNHCHVG